MSDYIYDEELEEEVSQDDYHGRCSPGDVEIPNRVFVKGFAKECTKEELKAFFEIYGIVHEANIVCDKSGISRGYAFISFDRQEIAEKVKEMGKVLYKGREIVTGPAKIRKRKPVPWQRGNDFQSCNAPVYISPDGVWYYHMPSMFTPPTSPVYHTNEVGFQQYPYLVASTEVFSPATTTDNNTALPLHVQPTLSQNNVMSPPPSPATTHQKNITSPSKQTESLLSPQKCITTNAQTVPQQQQNKRPLVTPSPHSLPQTNVHLTSASYQPSLPIVQNIIPSSPTQNCVPASTVPIVMSTSSVEGSNMAVVSTQVQSNNGLHPTTDGHVYSAPYNMVEMRSALPVNPNHHSIQFVHGHGHGSMQPMINATPHVFYTPAPMHCIPIQYDHRYIEEASTENLHTNILYYDPTKVHQPVV